MSRIGKKPISLPDGVTVTVDDANLVTVKGAKGELTFNAHTEMTVNVNENILEVERPSESKTHRAIHQLQK